MKKASIIALILCFALTTVAFGHKGEVHSYMGTVTKVQANGSFVMKTTDGKDVSFTTAKNTTYAHADNQPAKRSDIKVGTRVVVKISKDGKTAMSVKIASAAKAKK